MLIAPEATSVFFSYHHYKVVTNTGSDSNLAHDHEASAAAIFLLRTRGILHVENLTAVTLHFSFSWWNYECQYTRGGCAWPHGSCPARALRQPSFDYSPAMPCS